MTTRIWKPALALGAVLVVAGTAGAADRDTMLLSGGSTGSATITLGGQGTVAQAVTEDVELTGDDEARNLSLAGTRPGPLPSPSGHLAADVTGPLSPTASGTC